MHVHLAGRRLKDQMGAGRRRAGGGLEFYDRAEKKTFAAQVISAKMLRIRLTCLLRVRGNAKRQCDSKCECACLTSYRSFHIPFPAARVPLGTFPRCGHETKKQLRSASLRFISLDGESPIGGSRVVGKISYAATLTGTARLHRVFPTDYKPVPGEKVARLPGEK